jgi:ligand-binding SRPBCC domain-containing protein
MAFYQLRYEQKLTASLEEVWEFISSPKNLQRITPPSMGFDIITKPLPEKMYAGMIVGYKVAPVGGLKTTWVTEITHVEPLQFFVDEQRQGPYKMWHHEHHVELTKDGKVLMTDIISYCPPLGFLGRIANALFIRRKINSIFEYRRQQLNKLWNDN